MDSLSGHSHCPLLYIKGPDLHNHLINYYQGVAAKNYEMGRPLKKQLLKENTIGVIFHGK
jgi:hypothetical protein